MDKYAGYYDGTFHARTSPTEKKDGEKKET